MQISIASGKGGTGKTTLAVNLAVAAAAAPETNRRYAAVQILDCDVEEPNCHVFLRPSLSLRQDVTVPVPVVDKSRCTRCGICGEVCAFHAILSAKKVLVFPELCHGCGACGYLCPEHCIEEVPRKMGVLESGVSLIGDAALDFSHGILNPGEALAAPLVKRVREEAKQESLVIIDSPPGTSCTMMASVKESDLCVLVTEPTPFGLHDLELAYEATEKLNVPSVVAINRADIGDDRVRDYCSAKGLPILSEIPLDRELARLSAGGHVAAASSEQYLSLFSEILGKIVSMAKGRSGEVRDQPIQSQDHFALKLTHKTNERILP